MQFRPSRREFLAATAALAAAPALGQVGGDADVAIVGAGAAGIAAARRIASAGKTYALLEASGRTGGRVWSTAGSFGVSHDRGAHRISSSGRNPLVAFGRLQNLPFYDPAPFRRLQVGLREARDGEYDNFTAALRRSSRAIVAAGEAGLDIAAARALPDLGDWLATVAFVLGPLNTSKDLLDVSTIDYARQEDLPDELACRGGFGRLFDAAARSLAVQKDAPVTGIDTRGRGSITVETGRGSVRAEAVIVTVSTGVLASERIKFEPALSRRTTDAWNALAPGTHDRLVLELPGNPLRLSDDQRLLFKASDSNTVALIGRVAGSDLAYVEFCGRFGREMSDTGEAAMRSFVTELLVRHFGGDLRKQVARGEAVHWSRDPWVLGGTSAAAPGRGSARRILAEPVQDRIFFGGEAVHETWWGSVAGAWVSGERAADAALAYLNRKERAAQPAKSRGRRGK